MLIVDVVLSFSRLTSLLAAFFEWLRSNAFGLLLNVKVLGFIRWRPDWTDPSDR